MSGTAVALAVFCTVFVAFIIPFFVVDGIPRIAGRIPRHPKTPAAMLAKAMCHPATIGDWKISRDKMGSTCFINEKMEISVRKEMFGGGLDPGFTVSWADQHKLRRAAEKIQERGERASEVAATQRIVEQFERAYGT